MNELSKFPTVKINLTSVLKIILGVLLRIRTLVIDFEHVQDLSWTC